jgi:hypothetical protein
MPSRRKLPGPFSRDQSLANPDRRTKAGRTLKTVIAELVAHVGDPSAAQRPVIQSCAIKAVRLLAWLESMRRDLQTLGMERRERPILDRASHLQSKTTDVPAGGRASPDLP